MFMLPRNSKMLYWLPTAAIGAAIIGFGLATTAMAANAGDTTHNRPAYQVAERSEAAQAASAAPPCVPATPRSIR